MKLKATSNKLLELIALQLGLVPTPIVDTSIGMCLSRIIILSVELDIFECLEFNHLSYVEIAKICKTDPKATKKLLDVLVSCGYLTVINDKYSLEKIASKWLMKSSKYSIRDLIIFLKHQWDLITNNFETFIKTGKTVELHKSLSSQDWQLYQKGMRSLANIYVSNFVKHVPMPTNAKKMIDIGGSHGYLSVSLCRKYPGLTSKILDLPEAIKFAAPILEEEKMGDIVTHVKGDALKYDFGENEWDVILVSQLLHHFDKETNQDLCKRLSFALKPGGILIVQEIIRSIEPQKLGMADSIMDLFFAFTSQSGTWSVEEITNWQQNALLVSQKPIFFREVPGLVSQVAVKRNETL